MNHPPFDLATMRQIRGAAEVGTALDGQAVLVNLQLEDGSTEWMSMRPARLGQFVASLLFAAGVAADDRRTAAGEGKPVDESSAVVDIVRVNAASSPGADYIVIRMVVGEGANLDFRIPLAVAPALQAKIAEALATAAA